MNFLRIYVHVHSCLALRYVRDYECNPRLHIAALNAASDLVTTPPLVAVLWLSEYTLYFASTFLKQELLH